MHQNIVFTHMIVRYDDRDTWLGVTVAFATSMAEANTLLHHFIAMAPFFAPTALYAVRDIDTAYLYQKVY